MKVVFLCGGIGKRMFPITEDKFLLKFLGRTLLEHQVELARRAGLTQFVIVGNPANIEGIKELTRGITGATFEFAVQSEPLGMANALESARGLLSEEPILVVNPNDIFDGSAYVGMLREYEKGAATCYILASRITSYFPGGYLVVNSRNELQRIVEKPKKGQEPSDLVNIVVHLHTEPAMLFEHMASVTRDSDDVYEQALDRMVKQGDRIKVVVHNSSWTAIKYPWHIFNVMEYLLNNSQRQILPSAQVSAQATIEGDVILEENVKVLEHAVIRGPCYIGRNSIIGNNVLIRDKSHIGDNCVVGYGTEVKHSYIGDNCWFHSCYVGDSIVADNCSFGAGTVLANLRFDEGNIRIKVGEEIVDTGLNKLGAIIGNNSRTGVNASIMPGIRVGPNSIVGSHTCLTRDLGPDRMIWARPSYQIVEKERCVG